MKITFLGTGTSVGVPRIGCFCPVCTSDDPKNKRLRCALHIEHDGYSILVDTGPDLRTQALAYGLNRVDAVLFTHGHADHLHGLDDVRCYCFDRDSPLPCHADARTIERIERVFDYAFEENAPSTTPQIELVEIDGTFELFGLKIEPLSVYHGRLPVLAFRIGSFAYVTDTNRIPQESMTQLQDLDVLVLDALRHKKHPTHFNVEQALEVVEELKPKRTYFTHMAHDLEHHATNAALPNHVQLAYDGLELEIS
ncbi:MAG: MBL fold metallo-hydrolase [Candidatus Latescibacterota bacterium]|jgi:phosphoribosyl 1,2-cyclic phosphate phosphodiesterase